MISNVKKSMAWVAAALVATTAPAGLMAQETDPETGEVLTTVYGVQAPDLADLSEGPEVEGFISARDGERMQVTSPDGTATVVTLHEDTSIKAKSGLFGVGRKTLDADSLLTGLPVEVKTVQWNGELLASQVRFSDGELDSASMIRTGTSQRFAQQGAAIEENAAATEALRGRVADIDQYNIKGTTNVYFDTGRYNLSAQARGELCAAAQQADSMDNALLLVVGYTDSTGTYEINQALSEKRAGRVVNYLQQQCGWKPWRMLPPTGMAEADPAADNSTAYGKAQNRRVAVNILVSKGVDGL